MYCIKQHAARGFEHGYRSAGVLHLWVTRGKLYIIRIGENNTYF